MIGVTEQGKGQAELDLELDVRLDGIGADAQDRRAGSQDGAMVVPESTRFSRAAGRVYPRLGYTTCRPSLLFTNKHSPPRA